MEDEQVKSSEGGPEETSEVEGGIPPLEEALWRKILNRPRAKIESRFRDEVLEAKALLDFAVAQGFTTADGRKVDDRLVDQVKLAEDWLATGEFPSGEQRGQFEKSYRDLTLLLAPVTAKTLQATSHEYGRRSRLFAPFRARSEATIWSRKLSGFTVLFVAVALAYNLINEVHGRYQPPIDESQGLGTLFSHYFRTFLEILQPFIYGGIGACAYLLRSCHQYIYTRQFDPERIPEYINRILLGVVSGGAIVLFVSQLTTNQGATVKLSAAALGFLAGYNTDFLFSAIERIAAAILPKVGVETVRQAQPRSAAALSIEGVSLKDLLDRLNQATNDEERKLLQGLIERLKEQL